jgi:hypothetical protein
MPQAYAYLVAASESLAGSDVWMRKPGVLQRRVAETKLGAVNASPALTISESDGLATSCHLQARCRHRRIRGSSDVHRRVVYDVDLGRGSGSKHEDADEYLVPPRWKRSVQHRVSGDRIVVAEHAAI